MADKTYTKEEIIKKITKLIARYKEVDIRINEQDRKREELNTTQIEMSSRIANLERRISELENKPQTRGGINGDIEERLNNLEVQQRGLFDKIKKACQKVKQGVQNVVDKAKNIPGVQEAYNFAKANVPGVAQAVDVAHKVGIRDLYDDFPELMPPEERSCNPYLRTSFNSDGVSCYRRRDLGTIEQSQQIKAQAELEALKKNIEGLNHALGFNPQFEERGLKEIKNWIKEGVDTAIDKAKEMYYTVKNEVFHRDIGGDQMVIEKVKIELDQVINTKIETALKPYRAEFVKLQKKIKRIPPRMHGEIHPQLTYIPPSAPPPQMPEPQNRDIDPERPRKKYPIKRMNAGTIPSPPQRPLQRPPQPVPKY